MAAGGAAGGAAAAASPENETFLAAALASPAGTAGAAAEAVEGFTPCASFEGARPGKVFKRGAAGVGYYDEPSAAAPAVPAGEAKPAAKKVSFSGEAAVAAPPAAPPAAKKADLDELD